MLNGLSNASDYVQDVSTQAGQNVIAAFENVEGAVSRPLSYAGDSMQAAFKSGTSAWRSAVHSILLPPPEHHISKQEAALRVFLGGLNFGILCFPYAFRMSGMLNGVLFVFAIALLNNYTTRLILQAQKKLTQERGTNLSTLPDIMHALFGSAGSNFVGYLMFACQFGFAVSHCIFIGISMSALLKEMDSSWPWFHSIGEYESYVAFVSVFGIGFSLLVQISDGRSIAPYQRMAAVAMSIAVVVTLVHGLLFPSVCDKDDLIRTFCHVHKARWETLPIFFGIAIFVLESVPVVLAIEGSMENPQELQSALDIGQAGLTLLYISVGVLGYWIYGANTMSVIALNVSGIPGAVVKLLQCFFMSVTYVGVFIPACHFLEELVSGELVASLYRPIDPAFKALRAVTPRPEVPSGFQPFKVLVVLATVSLALAFPHFGHFMSLIGCLTFTVLTLAVPPVVYIKAFEDSMSRATFLKCVLVLLLTLVIPVLGVMSNFHNVRHIDHIDRAPPTPPDRPSYLHAVYTRNHSVPPPPHAPAGSADHLRGSAGAVRFEGGGHRPPHLSRPASTRPSAKRHAAAGPQTPFHPLEPAPDQSAYKRK